MDGTDLAILREMGRDKVMWWGSVDPRLGASALADRLGLPRSTVRERLRAWERAGFLVGIETLPNPTLFGVSLAGGSVRVLSPQAKPRLLRDLEDVEGLVLALDHVGEWLAIEVVHDSDAALERRRRLLSRLPGVAGLEPCVPHRVTGTTAQPSPLDWRILQALRRGSRRAVGEMAAEVGVSAKTFTRRFERLVAAGAIWSVPILDFTRYAGAVVVRLLVNLSPKANPALLAQTLRAKFPTILEMDNSYRVLPEVSEGQLELVLQLPTAAGVEDAERGILALPGVVGTEVLYPRRLHLFGHWFDERLAERVRAGRT